MRPISVWSARVARRAGGIAGSFANVRPPMGLVRGGGIGPHSQATGPGWTVPRDRVRLLAHDARGVPVYRGVGAEAAAIVVVQAGVGVLRGDERRAGRLLPAVGHEVLALEGPW